MDCTLGNCSFGHLYYAFNMANTTGVTTTASYSYLGYDILMCRRSGGPIKISNFVPVANTSCSNFITALTINPIPVLVAVDSSWISYESGIKSSCTTSTPNFYLLLVGVNSVAWTLKNSWGIFWGESGFIRLAPGNTCSMCQSPTYQPVIWHSHLLILNIKSSIFKTWCSSDRLVVTGALFWKSQWNANSRDRLKPFINTLKTQKETELLCTYIVETIDSSIITAKWSLQFRLLLRLVYRLYLKPRRISCSLVLFPTYSDLHQISEALLLVLCLAIGNFPLLGSNVQTSNKVRSTTIAHLRKG